MLGFIALIAILYVIVKNYLNIPSWRTMRYFNKLPGPTDLPFYVGILWKVLKMKLEDVIPYLKEITDDNGGISSYYAVGVPTVILTNPDYLEGILKSTNNIDKGPEYRFLTDWLGEGLLLSTGEKWKHRRKLLTPSFHFKILENSTECMNRNWKNVVEKFLMANGAPVEPLPILGQGALDIICETAMGTKLGADAGGEEYGKAVTRTTKNSVLRAISPMRRINLIHRMSAFGKAMIEDIQTLHNFTERVIRERKVVYEEKKSVEEYSDSESKTPQVFIDSIFDCAEKENLKIQDIREEVDTFMFAGHDTTSTALQFVLLHLGQHPDIQEKAYQEQFDIFGHSDRDAMKEDINKMHYLEQVIKESLRLHPPAPQIARHLVEDVELCNGMILPAGCKALINIFLLHRDPKHFPDPDTFNPDRFSPDGSKNRHPFCFLPFSAGPRNCIGQKFAMIEMKIGVSTILRSCRVKALTKYEDLRYEMLITLKPTKPIRIEVTPRY